MKKISLVMLSVLMVAVAIAQNVNDGIKQLYYQKYNTAKQTFQAAVNANPKDGNAIYWLGQAYLAGTTPDIAGAKALYQKGLNEIGSSDPMLLVGMGHIDLLEGRNNDARQKFETAISLSMQKKNPNPVVLAAIGRANADGSSTVGDPQYGIEKLKKAAELNTTDPEIFVNMGISYQKLGGERGGDAVQSYNQALQRDPKYARALFRIGRIYESQQNKDLFDEYYNKAISADPLYTPTYLALYDYYKDRDVNKALSSLQDYIKYAEPNPENEYFMADYLFRAGKYQESLAKGKELEGKYGISALPKLYVLYAYNYDRLKDSVQAKTNIQKYLTTAKQTDIVPDYYILAASIVSKFPGLENEASGYFEKAIASDTVKANQIDYMNAAATLFDKAGKYEQEYNWLLRIANLKGTWGEIDHYKLNTIAFQAGAYKRVLDTLGPKYIAAFPDKPQGYAYRVRAAKAIDTAASLGLAIEPLNQQNEYLMKDTAKNKKAVYLNYYYMLVYYNDKAKDIPKAIEMTDKMMALYTPGTEEYTFAETTKKALQSRPTKPTKPTTPNKGGGTTTTGGTGTTKTSTSSGNKK